jgi:nickel/cobalt transporter (NicO) family protein
MKRSVHTFAIALVLLVLSTDVRGHRLDEYLQAARLSLASERVALEIDLTPGIAIAPGIISDIDSDRDGTIAPVEARAYGQAVLSNIVVTLDGRPVNVSMDRIEVSPAGELRDGVGSIQLRANGTVKRLTAGRHDLRFENNHHPDAAVYLVNALAPDDRSVGVVGQYRDPSQRTARIEYDVRRHAIAQWLWLLAAAAACFHRLAASALRRKQFGRLTHPSA